jgi:hypothetical protein
MNAAIADDAVEEWLTRDIALIYDEMKQNPSRARTVEQVLATLAAEEERRL